MKKNVSGSSTDRNGPRIFMPMAWCAGTLLDSNISRNSVRFPGLVLYVRISMITAAPRKASIMRHVRPGVLPLQAMDRRGGGTRLLDDYRSGSHGGPF